MSSVREIVIKATQASHPPLGNSFKPSATGLQQEEIILRDGLTEHPGDMDIYTRLALCLHLQTKDDEAIEMWNDLIQKTPNDRKLWDGLLGSLMAAEKPRSVIVTAQATARQHIPDYTCPYDEAGIHHARTAHCG